MARKENSNPALRELIKERGIKNLQGVHDLVKELTGTLIQELLEYMAREPIRKNVLFLTTIQ